MSRHTAERPSTTADLDARLSEPPPYVIDALGRLEGDVLVLGVAGKMGPTLARMAVHALQHLGRPDRRVTGVARFSNPRHRQQLEAWGVHTIKADLLDPAALAGLPDAPSVVYMAGMKFGSAGNEPLTWAMNAWLPATVCERYRGSRIAAFSTGNVYGLYPVQQGGPTETSPTAPVGEYAMSCLGRERMFQYFSQTHGTPVSILRINYACELRYGVLVDLARTVLAGEPVDLSMGNFNILWQADANAMSLASLALATSPATILNVAGPETLSVRQVATEFARRLGREVIFRGVEAPSAIVSNAQLASRTFGYPTVPPHQLIEWIADWVKAGGESLNKPTHFETRDGTY